MSPVAIIPILIFQFPPLREGRPADVLHTAGPMLFQFPPLREGRRDGTDGQGPHLPISIPAPARGATSTPGCKRFSFPISIPAPARGATHMRCIVCGKAFISIPAPARGATISGPACRKGQTYFNSRPCARGDSTPWKINTYPVAFQFPPLREGRLMVQRLISC